MIDQETSPHAKGSHGWFACRLLSETPADPVEAQVTLAAAHVNALIAIEERLGQIVDALESR